MAPPDLAKRRRLIAIAAKRVNFQRDPVTALFIQSINELIESFLRRESQITRHVPESVLLVLFITFVLTGFVVGFSSGAEGDHPSSASYIAAIVIVLMVFVIIDLDHPRRGLIEVPRESLIDLQTTIQTDQVLESRKIGACCDALGKGR